MTYVQDYIDRSYIQSNLNSSNTDGSFAMANSNSFLSPYEILSIAQENKYLAIFHFYNEIVCCVYSLESPHRCDSNVYTQHTVVCCVYSLESPHRCDSNEYTQHTIIEQNMEKKSLNYRVLLSDTIMNPHWLELPMSRTNFHGPKGVRAIEVRLYCTVLPCIPSFCFVGAFCLFLFLVLFIYLFIYFFFLCVFVFIFIFFIYLFLRIVVIAVVVVFYRQVNQNYCVYQK